MKACPGQKSQNKFTFQTAKPIKRFVIKGVPAEVAEQEFKEFLGLDKISYDKAEILTSKKRTVGF